MNYRKISAKIILLLLILLPFFSAFPANAAPVLKVKIKSDYVQINGGGTANLTIEVRDALNNLLNGANVVLTSPNCVGASFAPSTGTTGPVPNGIFTSVFTGPAAPPTVVCTLKATVTSGTDTGSATAIIVVGSDYAPLVPLPGIGSPTSFPAYLVGLYELALMSIGIFAMLMILYGGFKYMTSAGNPALMGDAKDAIWSAIFGLILALLSWLILGTVNPELTMIKTPGTTFAPFTVPTSTPSMNCSIEGALTERVCQCINGENIIQTGPPPPYSTCDSACEASYNCYNFKMGMSQMTGNSLATDKERAQKYALLSGYTWNTAIDYTYCADGHFDINAADFTSKFSDVTNMTIDRGVGTPNYFDGDCSHTSPDHLDLLAEPNPGYFGPQAIAMSCPIGAISTNYALWEADPNCRKINNPNAVICPVKLCITWNTTSGPVSKSMIQYLKFIKP